MNTPIRTKDITLTDNTRDHIQKAKEQFMKYGLDITTINVLLSKVKQGVEAEFDIHIAHNTPIVISQQDNDLDAAIDLAVGRANKALRRLHDKVKSHRGPGLKDIEVQEA
jgi:ribosomal subunit interface protein